MMTPTLGPTIRSICEASGFVVNQTFFDRRKHNRRIKFCGIHWSSPSTATSKVKRNVLRKVRKVLPKGATAVFETRYCFHFNYSYPALIVRIPLK